MRLKQTANCLLNNRWMFCLLCIIALYAKIIVCVCWPLLPKAINQNEYAARSHINRFSLGLEKQKKKTKGAKEIQFELMFTRGCKDKQLS